MKPWINFVPNVTEIDLGNNNILEIPPWLVTKGLTKILMDNCSITCLPHDIFNYQLEVVDFSDNEG